MSLIITRCPWFFVVSGDSQFQDKSADRILRIPSEQFHQPPGPAAQLRREAYPGQFRHVLEQTSVSLCGQL